jgi:hypothetical protein
MREELRGRVDARKALQTWRPGWSNVPITGCDGLPGGGHRRAFPSLEELKLRARREACQERARESSAWASAAVMRRASFRPKMSRTALWISGQMVVMPSVMAVTRYSRAVAA